MEIVASTAYIPNIMPAMPTTALSSAFRLKQKLGKLFLVKLAMDIGTNCPYVTSVLKGKSVPNATAAPRYAKFLGDFC